MTDSRIDLAHAVALGSIDDEDQDEVQQLLDSAGPEVRAAFHTEVQQSADALTALAELTATAPPPALRARLLAAIAAEQPPVAS
ncbi:RskA family anti-sigma factor [Nocardia farcinica]|uniref:RskA family anti-sigma factor n=1 Tax=Nocardia farcinica TaxID=37329 RepID=UPI002454C7F1|nr:hypothetical protein [Nocardia farcinica]